MTKEGRRDIKSAIRDMVGGCFITINEDCCEEIEQIGSELELKTFVDVGHISYQLIENVGKPGLYILQFDNTTDGEDVLNVILASTLGELRGESVSPYMRFVITNCDLYNNEVAREYLMMAHGMIYFDMSYFDKEDK